MKNLIVLLLMLGAVQGFAADGGSMPVQSQPPSPRPKLVKVGDDYFLDMQDGRVAGFFQMIGKVVRTGIGLRQIENTCDFAQELSECGLELDVALRGFSLRWVKHADATKLNSVVILHTVDNEKMPVAIPLEETQNAIYWYTTLKDKTYASAFNKADRLICNNFAWAKNIPVTNARLKIHTWSSEVMFPSSETGTNENQTASTSFDVVLKTIDTKTLEFESFGQEKSFIAGIPPYLSGQVANLTFADKNKQICQVSFESSQEDNGKLQNDPDFLKLDPKTMRPLRKATAITNSMFYNSILGALGPYSKAEFE
jgi:hypothetical protein